MSIYFDGNSEGVTMVQTNLPMVTYVPEPKWISVDERLPREGEWVLVWYEYFRYGDYNCMFQTYGIGVQYRGYWSGDVQGTRAKCLYWMQLPEPPMTAKE